MSVRFLNLARASRSIPHDEVRLKETWANASKMHDITSAGARIRQVGAIPSLTSGRTFIPNKPTVCFEAVLRPIQTFVIGRTGDMRQQGGMSAFGHPNR